MKTIRLNCNCSISCRSPLPMPPLECAVARATGARRRRMRMLLCRLLHPQEPCQPRSSRSWDGFNAFLPGAILAAMGSSTLARRDRWQQLSSTAPSSQDAGTAPLQRAAVPGSICRRFGVHSSSLMRKKVLYHNSGILFFWWFPICVLLALHSPSLL